MTSTSRIVKITEHHLELNKNSSGDVEEISESTKEIANLHKADQESGGKGGERKTNEGEDMTERSHHSDLEIPKFFSASNSRISELAKISRSLK